MSEHSQGPTSAQIRRFAPKVDEPLVADLWRRALSPEWPLLPDGVALLRDGFVAERDGRCVGMVAVAMDDGAAVPFIAVMPEERRRGIGTLLVRTAVDYLREWGAVRVGFGSGAGPYIWPGVPLDLVDAGAFFDALGWHLDHIVSDLVANLRRPGFDDHLAAFALPPGVQVTEAAPDDIPTVLAFEDTYFPEWSRWFLDQANDIVVARDRTDTIVGSLLIAGPGQATMYWPILGEGAATIGCVGVAPSAQARGIGSAMVAAASQILRRRGADICHIGWTVRTNFYERVGFELWRSYSIRWVNL